MPIFFNNAKAREHALFTLEKMLNGGIFDQLAGGISRYSTDDEWLVPHFEKMLYDNALFVSVLCDAFTLTKEDRFKKGVEKTLGFILREMKHPEGGYFTALDADSEGEEGRFYVWQKQEIDALLGTDAKSFCEYYGVTSRGNWEGKNILNVQRINKFVADGWTDAEVEKHILENEGILLAARSKRVRPGTDDKILLSSNALLITAFCKAFAATGNEEYRDAATDLFEFLVVNLKDPQATGFLYHTYKNGQGKYAAFLDDYAYLIQACIQLQEICYDQKYLLFAKGLEFLLQNFSDDKGEFFYYTHSNQQDILVRKLELYDGATASGNAIMAQNLFYLASIFDKRSWYRRALAMLTSLEDVYSKHPSSFAVWAWLYLMQTAGIAEVAITGENITAPLKNILKEFLPKQSFAEQYQKKKIFRYYSGRLTKKNQLFTFAKTTIVKNLRKKFPLLLIC